MGVKHNLFNPGGINTGNPLERTICPVTIGTLREFYVVLEFSTWEIADILSKMVTRQLSSTVICNWLRRAGIQRRDAGRAGTMTANLYRTEKKYIRKDPSSFKSNESTRFKPNDPRFSDKSFVKKRNHGSRAANAKKRMLRSTFICSNPRCKKEFQKLPSQIKGDRHFCSRICQNRFLSQQHHDRTVERRIRGGQPIGGLIGSTHPRSKLTDEQVAHIRASQGLVSSPKLASIYGVSAVTICRIWRNEGYAISEKASNANSENAASRMPDLAAYLGITPEQMSAQG